MDRQYAAFISYRHADLDSAVSDTCNMGYGAYELFRVWNRLKEIGIEKPEYLAAAVTRLNFFFYKLFTNNARIALSTAIIITPTSANMATHILATPSAPRTRHSSFMPMANTVFS